MSTFDQKHQKVDEQYNIARDLHIHQGISPRKTEEQDLKAARARLARLPVDRISKVAAPPMLVPPASTLTPAPVPSPKCARRSEVHRRMHIPSSNVEEEMAASAVLQVLRW